MIKGKRLAEHEARGQVTQAIAEWETAVVEVRATPASASKAKRERILIAESKAYNNIDRALSAYGRAVAARVRAEERN